MAGRRTVFGHTRKPCADGSAAFLLGPTLSGCCFRYNSCDVGTFRNQTLKDGSGPAAALNSTTSNYQLSVLSGQRLSYVPPPPSYAAASTHSLTHARILLPSARAPAQGKTTPAPRITRAGAHPRSTSSRRSGTNAGAAKSRRSPPSSRRSRTTTSISTRPPTGGIYIIPPLRRLIHTSESVPPPSPLWVSRVLTNRLCTGARRCSRSCRR